MPDFPGTSITGHLTGRRNVSVYGLTWAMPMVLWQLIFFIFPLMFLLLMSFWLVKNYRMVPGFDSINWEKMY